MEKRRNLIMAALAVMISLMLTACVWRTETVSAKVEKTQEHMAEEVLRFHVLANSDSKEDQNLKMKVKDTVVSWMEEEMDTESLAQTKAFIRSHLPQIEAGQSSRKRPTGISPFRPERMKRSGSRSGKQKGTTGGVFCIRAFALSTASMRSSRKKGKSSWNMS